MSYGLQIWGNAGVLQIDSDYRNHIVVQSGSFSMPGGPGFNSATVAFANAWPDPPLIFARCAKSIALYGYSIDGSGNFSGFDIVGDTSDAAATVEYYVCALSPAISAETHGLRVYDAAGRLSFDSGLEYMKFADLVSYAPDPAGAEVIVNHEGSDAYYCLNGVQGQVCAIVSLSPPRTGFYNLGVRKISDTQAALRFMPVKVIGGTLSLTYVPSPQILAVGSLHV